MTLQKELEKLYRYYQEGGKKAHQPKQKIHHNLKQDYIKPH